MPYEKGNLIHNGGTADKCCKTCCEMDKMKNSEHGYCVYEGVVKTNDICPLHLAGGWEHRIELRKQRQLS